MNVGISTSVVVACSGVPVEMDLLPVRFMLMDPLRERYLDNVLHFIRVSRERAREYRGDETLAKALVAAPDGKWFEVLGP